MNDAKMMRKGAIFLVFYVVGVVVTVSTAAGHDLHLFAAVAGENITGYTYYNGGERVPNVDIEIWGAGDDIVFMGKTDEKGEFSFSPRYQSDYKVVAISGDGHRAAQEIKAGSLPAGLPEKGDVGGDLLAGVPAFGWSGADEMGGAEMGVTEEALRAMVEEAVARQVRPLQEQLQQYESKVRVRDIVGGIGFICGLAGVALFFAAKRKK